MFRAGLQIALAVLVGAATLGCAQQAPLHIEAGGLYHDALFKAPREPIDADSLFALSDEMRHFAQAAFLAPDAPRDRRQALFNALTPQGRLQLGYDAAATRNAAQAFQARAGNCLSLVVMTAAFAKHLKLPVSYQSVIVEQEYERSGGLYLVNGHINIVLGRHRQHTHNADARWLTIDFLPPEEMRGQRAQPIDEATVVAMYLNNRAAEALAQGQVHDAYWRASEALQRDPQFLAAANTLGVIYQRAGHDRHAEAAFAYVLERDGRNTSALSNLARLLRASGRDAEAEVLAQRLVALQPQPPFWFFDLGRAALQRGEYPEARELFKRELRLQPNQHEVHFWLAQTFAALGDVNASARHLALAAGNGVTGEQRSAYAAKLSRLRDAAKP